jgi:hypothetical protein
MATELDWISQVKNKPAVEPKQYRFNRIGAQNLTASAPATMSLRNLSLLVNFPTGITASSAGVHYLRITDSVAGNEQVLLTAVDVSAGTVTFTPALSHTAGNWQIMSATMGIQEAVFTIGVEARATILISGGPPFFYIYAPITIASSYISLAGLGFHTSILRAGFAAGDVVYINSPAEGRVSVTGLRFLTDVVRSSGAFLHIKNATGMVIIDGVRTDGGVDGIYLEEVNDPNVSLTETIGFSAHGFWLKSGAVVVGGKFANCGTGGGTDPVASVGLLAQADTGGAFAGLTLASFTSQGSAYGISLYAAGGVLGEIVGNGVILDSNQVQHLRMLSSAGGSGNGIHLHNVRFGGNPSPKLVEVPREFTNVNIVGVTGSTAGDSAVKFSGAVNASLIGAHIGGSGNALDVAVEIAVDGSGNPCDNISISDSKLGYTEAGATTGNVSKYGVATTAAAHTKIHIGNNDIFGSTNSILSNGTSASGCVVVGNRLDAAATFAVRPALLESNLGIDDVTPNVASGATVAIPINPFFFLTGNTAAGAVSGVQPGQRGTFVATHATPGAWTAGATIGNSFTPTQNVPVVFFVDATGKIWLK